MKIITVNRVGLIAEMNNWGVRHEYVEFFLSKCAIADKCVSLRPFLFNDTVHLDDKHQWLAASAALWCRVYREAEFIVAQVEAISAIRSIYYLAGLLGQGSITTAITAWWNLTHELHQLPAVNRSAASPYPFNEDILKRPRVTH